MTDFVSSKLRRRTFLGGALASSMLALPGCESLGGFSLVDAIRRLLFVSSERAFARLTAPDGFWDEAVGKIGLDAVLGTRANALGGILTSAVFKNRLEDAFADIALEGSARAAPLVADAVRVIGIENAVALVNGGPGAATSFLRQSMGTTLVEAMVPELGNAMRMAEEPLVAELLASLTGIDIGGAARNLANHVDNTIWREISVEEAAIRADPLATNDPVLIGVFGAAARL